ncbi:precorrin-6y C5,15-methyltransferase subunit CbiE [Marinomonas ushuaiensis DSM 15871]|uniref:Precorrin-6y C5,15-methyltransferase subunit CbiE n=1 Tax=Marinomonas ushuaiensis DSM 15871 TaxID=1122207 RepID=X7E4P2_9GAMM|nr:bifunctional cobalt-precorrin-7 (C(5))-methyltransferase/cobalt-precorrin-6B (C(15))-methyltransferase [Marinomonas ushuaiensis]ETX10835.1 precorrin-6y C5,15-methyltransferase subunit CbiE [Marinomonas ushuaiensis DSM 15871]
MKIHVIGLGVNEQANLDASAQVTLANLSEQDIVLGAPRQHETISLYTHKAQYFDLPKLKQLESEFDNWQKQGAKQVVVLASGDPLYFGIGAWLMRHFSLNDVEFYPNVSSLQVACHRLGLSLQNVQTVSLHGRPLVSLRRYLHGNNTLVLLTDKHSQPKNIAQECVLAGLQNAEITVCEALGYGAEKVRTFSVNDLLKADITFDPLNVIVLKIPANNGFYPLAPGIPDTSFITDKGDGKGMITKREVRLAILSYMNIQNGDVVWDIGAGCGGVSVELAYWHPNSQIVSVEHHPDRLACLKANQERFGVVQNLSIVEGRAPEVLENILLKHKAPNKVFIGGSDGELVALMAQVWSLLPIGGSLMVSAVTEDTKYQIIQFAQQRETEQDAEEQSIQLAVAKGERLAGQRVYRPNLPVTLFHFTKASANSLHQIKITTKDSAL